MGGIRRKSAGDEVKLTTLARAANFAVASATSVNISWDTEINDEVNAVNLASSATNIVVPAGYTKARISVNTNWASSSTGDRWLLISKNGTVTLAGTLQKAAFESGNFVQSPWSTVVEGDIITVLVRHSHGSSLNMSGTSGMFASFVQVEWLP